MWDRSISFPSGGNITTDPDGFDTASETFITGIPANQLDTTRNDEILAKQSGYTASIIVETMKCNYDLAQNASYFIDESTGQVYNIVRTFHTDKSMKIQITGEARERGTV